MGTQVGTGGAWVQGPGDQGVSSSCTDSPAPQTATLCCRAAGGTALSPKLCWHPGKLKHREVTAITRDTRIQTQDPHMDYRW